MQLRSLTSGAIAIEHGTKNTAKVRRMFNIIYDGFYVNGKRFAKFMNGYHFHEMGNFADRM